jgi:hypothetical protein
MEFSFFSFMGEIMLNSRKSEEFYLLGYNAV